MKPKNTETVSMRISEDFSKVSEVEINGLRYTRSGESPAAALGRLGGKTKSAAKSSAARINGSKGGRPRKRKADLRLGV